jgi:hypothetical protein
MPYLEPLIQARPDLGRRQCHWAGPDAPNLTTGPPQRAEVGPCFLYALGVAKLFMAISACARRIWYAPAGSPTGVRISSIRFFTRSWTRLCHAATVRTTTARVSAISRARRGAPPFGHRGESAPECSVRADCRFSANPRGIHELPLTRRDQATRNSRIRSSASQFSYLFRDQPRSSTRVRKTSGSVQAT